MSDRKDLTRWNRAGLSRFTYVDGNAVEYLEMLRQQLAGKFEDVNWLIPSVPVPVNEKQGENDTLLDKQKRLHLREQRILEMYHQDRRDWAWEITRTFVRACHILTGYANAWANEGYLGTATQWDNVRRLVGLLDYHPAPPSSATTHLVFEAKNAGTVTRGFQVKNSPLMGAEKVVFETLEDLVADPELNGLRPKGWDKSNDPVVLLPGNNGNNQSSCEERQFSTLANGPVINLQGVGPVLAETLDPADPDAELVLGFRVSTIRDFLNIDPGSSAELGIGKVRLRELKAKAAAICNFELEPGWSDIVAWFLPRIASESPESLAEETGNSLDKVAVLQLRIELIGTYLDHEVYGKVTLKDLVAPSGSWGEPERVSTSWKAKQNPKVVPGQVAMIFHQLDNKAEAATVAKIDETSGMIDLLPSLAQYNWHSWSKSESRLHVVPRWHRECWLNGSMVIRTRDAHGITAGAFIAWTESKVWRYAEVTKADKRNLQLKAVVTFPQPDTELFVLSPIEGALVAADYEVIAILGGAETDDSTDFEVKDVSLEMESPPATGEIFTIKKPSSVSGGGGGLLPPASLPGIGSFLFPSPMLPMDLVKMAVDLLLSLGVMMIPSTKEFVIKGLPFGESLKNAENLTKAATALYDLLHALEMENEDGQMVPMVEWKIEGDDARIEALEELLGKAEENATPLFKEISADSLEGQGAPLVISKGATCKAVVEVSSPRYVINGSPGKLEAGMWIVGRFKDGLRALEIKAINEFAAGDQTETFSVTFENLVGHEEELLELYGDFRGELIAEGAEVNSEEIDSEDLELDEVPESLAAGRKVLLMADGKEAVVAKVVDVKGEIVTIDPPVSGFTKGNLIICGNVVEAGHGGVKPAKILGSGNAAKSNQDFTLRVEGVSFVPDETMRSGVAAAVDVEVEGRIWKQVSTLRDSVPVDHHYAIQMTEEGYLRILFGDGKNGRRLPSGKNNVRVRYRIGSGLAGNVAAHSLEKPVNKHPMISAVLQPVQAAGGGDMEDISSLRENAPSTLLALERAVSISDFADLATGRSNIWQAKARHEVIHSGQVERVRVTVVPADGVSSPTMIDDVRKFLQSHALPGVQVLVEPFGPDTDFKLHITIRVKSSEFLWADVAKKVRAALEDRFSLKRSKLGGALFLSEIYKVVEGIKGVENSICEIKREGLTNPQVIRPEYANKDAIQVLYLDPSKLTVEYEEYRP